MSKEPIGRLKEAVQGKEAVSQRKGRVHTVSVVEVSPWDILKACEKVREPTKRVLDIRGGSEGATEESPNVFLAIADVQHLIEQAEKHDKPEKPK